MSEPNRSAAESAAEAVEAVEASREEYVTEALLEAVRRVVALYRNESGELPAHVEALDRLAAAHEAYTRVFEAAAASHPPPA
jgi:hypothetical protein